MSLAIAPREPTESERSRSIKGSPLDLSFGSAALRLFASCWLVYTLHFATNTVREIYPALSLGDHFSFDVSQYSGFHPDIFEVPGRGAFINNNPGAPMLGAIPYVLTKPVIDRVVANVQHRRASAPELRPETIYPMAQEFHRRAWARGLDIKFGLAAGVMQALLMAPLSALSAVAMFVILRSALPSARTALLLAFLYAFATPVFFRTAQLNQNLLVSHFAFFAFVLLWKPSAGFLRLRNGRYFIAGLLAGWTVVLDYSGIVVVLSLAFYIGLLHLKKDNWQSLLKPLVFYGAGAASTMAVLLAYQWSAFGHPFYPAQYYMPTATFSHLGYRGMDWPKLDLLWDTAFSARFGLFTSAPLLLLSLYIPAWFRNYRFFGLPELYFVLGFSLLFFVFCASNQYGRMQFNSGVRHVVPVTPFLFLLAAAVLAKMPAVPACIVGILSVYWQWCLAMYRDVEQGLGVLEAIIHVTFEGFRLPWLTTVANMGYFPQGVSPIPLLFLSGTILWILWIAGLTQRKAEEMVETRAG
jgi:hypothetical protein